MIFLTFTLLNLLSWFSLSFITVNIKDFPSTKLFLFFSRISEKRNIGANSCDSKYLAFIDSDAYPKHKWLDHVLNSFKKLEDVKVIGGPNLSPSNKEFSFFS